MPVRAPGLLLAFAALALGCASPSEPLPVDEGTGDGASEDSTGELDSDPDPDPDPPEADLPEPLDPSCRIIEGILTCLPVDEAMGTIEGLMLFAEVDYAVANARVAEHGLLPLPVLGLDGQTHALVVLGVLDYEGTELLGPYQEFLLQTVIIDPEHPVPEPMDVLTLMQGLLGSTEVPVPMATVVEHLTLGSDDPEALRKAVEVGRDYFGFPKFYGEVGFQAVGLGHALMVDQPASQPFGPAALGAFSLRVELVDANPLAVPTAATTTFRAVTTGAGYPCWLDMTLESARVDPHLWTLADSWEATGGLGALLGDLKFTPRGWSHFEQTEGRLGAEQFCEPLAN